MRPRRQHHCVWEELALPLQKMWLTGQWSVCLYLALSFGSLIWRVQRRKSGLKPWIHHHLIQVWIWTSAEAVPPPASSSCLATSKLLQPHHDLAHRAVITEKWLSQLQTFFSKLRGDHSPCNTEVWGIPELWENRDTTTPPKSKKLSA